MELIKTKILFDGVSEQKDSFVGIEKNSIKYVGKEKPPGRHEIIYECGAVTPSFIDAHSHIGMVRSGEPADEEESNEHLDSVFPLVNALHSVYMDDPSFKESVESGILYSVVLPGSGNIIGGKAVLLKNYVSNIKDAFISDVGVKTALGYNPRSTEKWKGNRPSTRMGSIALLRDYLLKAQKATKLVKMKKKVTEELEPLTEIFIDILSGKNKLMVHVHKEDDIMILLNLVNEFKIKPIANHLCDVYTESVFSMLRSFSIPIIYGPLDSFPYKVELKHESWRNVEKLIKSKAKFALMSDHPVILQRNLFYGLRHLLRFGLSRSEAISKITKEPAEIIEAKKLGHISPGYTASLTLWNGDPFLMSSYPKTVIAEGKIVYNE
jgi:imidazolonepropionase-like amidohydrolase